MYLDALIIIKLIQQYGLILKKKLRPLDLEDLKDKEFLCYLSFGILSETMYVNSHKVLDVILGVLEELVPRVVIIMVILIIIISPIFEEILMRWIILEGILNKYKLATAIIISYIIFRVMHLNNSSIY